MFCILCLSGGGSCFLHVLFGYVTGVGCAFVVLVWSCVPRPLTGSLGPCILLLCTITGAPVPVLFLFPSHGMFLCSVFSLFSLFSLFIPMCIRLVG